MAEKIQFQIRGDGPAFELEKKVGDKDTERIAHVLPGSVGR
jgi:hypothetical protein